MSRTRLPLLLPLLFLAALAAGRPVPGPEDRQFVQASGSKFVLSGRPFYVNGFNAYWMPLRACDASFRQGISDFLHRVSGLGLSVARTWAFRNGYLLGAIQTKPGVYDEEAFQALDFAVAAAKQHGIKLIMTLNNNLPDYGGKAQYVQWAREAGVSLGSDDAFYTDATVKRYVKNYIQALLTRVNTITGVAYRDETAIMAWELVNEPRLDNDPSGNVLEAWITEMASFVKSVDANHLVSIGMEGFYSEEMTRMRTTPGEYSGRAGTDFVRHHRIPGIDYATVHAYPDYWQVSDAEQLKNMVAWVSEHLQDATTMIGKPVLIEEFGKRGSEVAQNELLSAIYGSIYASARSGGAAAGGLVWQLFAPGMSEWDDGYQLQLDDPATAAIISSASRRLAELSH